LLRSKKDYNNKHAYAGTNYCGSGVVPYQTAEAQSGVSRRAAISTATIGAALALIPVSVQPVFAAEEECEYLTAASGLQYCDVRMGDGDAPFKGESIRWVNGYSKLSIRCESVSIVNMIKHVYEGYWKRFPILRA
jgi:hypothetical protein